PHGTAASVLEGVTGYFQNRKIAIADVPPERRHDPHQPQQLYTEAFATARNGDVLAREDGSSIERWQLDDARHGRIEVRPQVPPAHASWLNQIEQDLGPRMTEAGYTPEQCQRVATACAGRWAQEGGAEMPTRLLLSKDQERIGWLDGQGRLAELRIDEALTPQQSVGANNAQAHSVQERGFTAGGIDTNAAAAPAPVMAAAVRVR